MGSQTTYIPQKGDLVWIDFDPSVCREIQKRRPALVVSKEAFNRSTYFAIVCPITSSIRDVPTRVTLPAHLETKGQVILSQLKSVDYRARSLAYIEKMPVDRMEVIDQIIGYIFY